MCLYSCSDSDAVNSRQLLVGPADVDAKLGDTVVFECAAKVYDDAGGSRVTWTRDGEYISIFVMKL